MTKSTENIKLTESQEIVLKQIISFIEHTNNDRWVDEDNLEVINFVDYSPNRVFILKGYAGTGKTTLMRFLINYLEEKSKDYRLLASTGRAAKVLANISGKAGNTSTIHSMIYSFKGLNKEYQENETQNADKDGQLFLVFEPVQLTDTLNHETIYIIDEASMISNVATKDITQAKFGSGRLLKELLEFDTCLNSKFIFVGDPCQLPPIEEYYSPALMKDYFNDVFKMTAQEAQLTEIMRQKGNNGIVDASKRVRSLYNNAPVDKNIYGNQCVWGFLPFRQYQNIQFHQNIEEITDCYVKKYKSNGPSNVICICRSNKDCGVLSAAIRTKLGHKSTHIEVGDLLMVVQNNLLTGLMNGDMVVVEEVFNKIEIRGYLTFRQIKVKELFNNISYTTLILEEVLYQSRLNLSSYQQQDLFVDFILRMREKGITQKDEQRFYDMMASDPYLNALRCKFGYAVTCHKSQGGEWDDVFLQVPRNITLNPTKETYQWIYTAMTRAKNTLHMIDDFFIR